MSSSGLWNKQQRPPPRAGSPRTQPAGQQFVGESVVYVCRLIASPVGSSDWTEGRYSISITDKQVKSIFLEVESIYNLNQQFFKEIVQRYSAWSVDQAVGGEKQLFSTLLPDNATSR